MVRNDVKVLMRRLRERYGDRYRPYIPQPVREDDNAGFKITDIPACFSVLCFGDTPIGRYDCQIESEPPGDYLYMIDTDLEGLLDLVEVYLKPMDQWPINRW